MFGASIRKYGINNNKYQGLSPQPDYSNPLLNEYYRSIEGYDHILFVIDIDREDLTEAFIDAQKVYAFNPQVWDYVKFSGCKGFHLIQKLPFNEDNDIYGLLKEKGNWIEDNISIDIDKSMFQQNRLIRAYSVNFKSGLCSIPVNLEHDKLDNILLRAVTLESLRNDMCLSKRTSIKGYKPEIEKFFGGISMASFETIRTTNPIDLGYGRFIELSVKRSPQGNEFISISRGEYWGDNKGKSGKRYQKSITMPNNNGVVEGVIHALTDLVGQSDTPTDNEIDKG